MATFACACHSQISLKTIRFSPSLAIKHRPISAFRGASTELFGRRVTKNGSMIESEWNFVRGLIVVCRPDVSRFSSYRKGLRVSASWLTNTEIASNVFTLGTAAVLPFYTLMIVVPKSKLAKRSMESSIPYVFLGILYVYLLSISWTPDTLRLLFANEYWLPELPGMIKLFSSELTLASAWVHLLAVDLFAARQVFHNGLKNEIETRHSVFLCMMCCPIGILSHVITKVLTKGVDVK